MEFLRNSRKTVAEGGAPPKVLASSFDELWHAAAPFALPRASHAWLIIGLTLANGYCLGAGCVERFVNYQTWPKIDTGSFQAYHRAQTPLIRCFVVLPLGISTLLQVAVLLIYRKMGIDSGPIWIMLASSLVGTLSTVFLQLPIHRKFDRDGYSEVLMQRLLTTDWIRKAADVLRFLVTALLLKNLIQP